jgi:hypothetical protein
MALVGMKKVTSGAINDISGTFTYLSASVKVSSALYLTGKDSPATKQVTIVDPLYLTNAVVTMPNIDLCKGQNCQMNILTLKDPPFSKVSNGKLVGATLSISFDNP